MRILTTHTNRKSARAGERGSALITALLLSTLLLAAGGALVMTTAMSSTLAINATAEMQAYYGAEAGLQTALNALNGNVPPFNNNAPALINFRSVLEPSISNVPLDGATTSAQPFARMSNWLNYADTSATSLVNVSGSIAYKLNAVDIDNSKSVTYTMTGSFNGGGTSRTVASSGIGSSTLTYVPPATSTVTAYPAVTNQALGSFTMTVPLTGSVKFDDRFTLTVTQTYPWYSRISFYGTVTGTVTAASSTVKIDFGNPTVDTDGVSYTLNSSPLTLNYVVAVGGTTPLQGTINSYNPKRVLIQATGFGPKGAQKRLQMVVSRYRFKIATPATIVIRGADAGTSANIAFGSSSAHADTGADVQNVESIKPAIGVSLADWNEVNNGIVKDQTVDDPQVGILDLDPVPPTASLSPAPNDPNLPPPSIPTPDYLTTADNARLFMATARKYAMDTGNYHSGNYSGAVGSDAAPRFLFIDGDCNLDGGAGLVIATGNVTINGGSAYSGIVMAMGKGNVQKSGGGGGKSYGSWIVARFDDTGNFLAPTFDISGGGNSEFKFDSVAVKRANRMVGNIVQGVVEQ
jgi:hypothetical protein